MKNRISWVQGILMLAVVAVLAAMAFRPPAAAKRKAVVVELFTSEGCSSCPPADDLLSKMGRKASLNGAEVIPLGFHVDYWDDLGWKDRFSSHSYTDRQQQYARKFRLDGPYTPQMVVDGQAELVGNDSGGAENAVTQAATRQQEAEVKLSWASPEELLVEVTGADKTAHGDVRLAIAEDNLSTSVAAGENNGHVLHHSAVVRDFRLLGQLSNGSFQKAVDVKPDKVWKVNDLRAVVFVQAGNQGAIAGAASINFSQSLTTGK
jgi:hypothetical protein